MMRHSDDNSNSASVAVPQGHVTPSAVKSPSQSCNTPARTRRNFTQHHARNCQSMDELGRFMYDAEVRGTFLFFGSARTQDKASQQATYAKLQADLAALQSQREPVAAAAPPSEVAR